MIYLNKYFLQNNNKIFSKSAIKFISICQMSDKQFDFVENS
jgi:hypothetical protein